MSIPTSTLIIHRMTTKSHMHQQIFNNPQEIQYKDEFKKRKRITKYTTGMNAHKTTIPLHLTPHLGYLILTISKAISHTDSNNA